MSNEKQSSVSTIGELQGQLAALADRLGGLEGLKEHQDGTIRCKQQENEASSQLIKVGRRGGRWGCWKPVLDMG